MIIEVFLDQSRKQRFFVFGESTLKHEDFFEWCGLVQYPRIHRRDQLVATNEVHLYC